MSVNSKLFRAYFPHIYFYNTEKIFDIPEPSVIHSIYLAKADLCKYYVMSCQPQLKNLFRPQCGLELTMSQSEDSCSNQFAPFRHKGIVVQS